MKNVLRIASLILAISCLYINISLAQGLINSSMSNSSANSGSVVLTAESGTITSQSGNDYKLEIVNPSPVLVCVSNNKNHKNGIKSTEKFLKWWMTPESDLKKDFPNAGIVYDELGKNGKIDALAVELKNPQQISNNTWSFDLKDLKGKIIPGSYHNISMFIDSMCLSCF